MSAAPIVLLPNMAEHPNKTIWMSRKYTTVNYRRDRANAVYLFVPHFFLYCVTKLIVTVAR